MTAARGRKGLRYWVVRMQFSPNPSDYVLLWLMDVILSSVKMQVVGATRLKMTPQSKILFTNYSIGVQPSEHFDQVAVKEVVVMPGYLIRMDKDRDIREAIVVIDDVAKIGHRLVAFVSRNAISCDRVIDDVDGRL